ncbi:MAG: hypothetical protein SGI88_18840 [Candidatus Hydrogenedentes bacterium]|nr:hypothetical protein [Candidatus Hydrogenedentota bacterium]
MKMTGWNSALFRIATYSFVAGMLLRIGVVAATHPHFVDYRCFVAATDAMARGMDPFARENLAWTPWDIAPLVYPGLATFFLPFVPLGLYAGAYLFFVLNVMAGLAYYAIVVRASGLCSQFSMRRPCAETALVVLGAFLYVNSIFFTLCIRAGQVSIWASLFFFLSLVAAGVSRRACCMGIAAAIKYSNIPLLALTSLSKGQLRCCVLAFCWFLALSLAPCIFGHSPITLYQSYARCLSQWMQPGGGNNFAESGQTMVSLGYFKPYGLNAIVSATLLGIFSVVLWKDRRFSRDINNLHVIFALVCLSLLLVYHRVYDAVLAYPILLVEAVALFRSNRRWHATVAAGFALVFVLPGAWWDITARKFGQAVGENSLIHLPNQFLPLTALVFSALAVYALSLALFESPFLIGRQPRQK